MFKKVQDLLEYYYGTFGHSRYRNTIFGRGGCKTSQSTETSTDYNLDYFSDQPHLQFSTMQCNCCVVQCLSARFSKHGELVYLGLDLIALSTPSTVFFGAVRRRNIRLCSAC